MRAILVAGASAAFALLSVAACGDSENATSSTDTTSAADTTGCFAACGGGGSGGGAATCGDGTCSAGESCGTCSADCGICACGDGVCEELCSTCPADCGACMGPPITVVRGPYLQQSSPDAVTVRWRTADPTESVVAFGTELGSLLSLAEGPPGPKTEHEVRLTGLTPDTLLHYAFGTPESDLVGGDADHYVVTPPPTGTSKPTRVWVIGDAGTGSSAQEAVRDAYYTFTGATRTDLWLMLGDNAYDDGTDAEYQEAVFDVYGAVLRNSVVWSTLGNHDGHSADSGAQSGPYYDIFTLPRQAEAGGVASGTEAYYAFDYGDIHFVCLDSYDSDRDPTGPMLTWLANDLAANAQPWTIAFWHHPPYSKGSHDSDSEGALVDMRENALPILEAHGVDLVLGGHSHAYERSMYLNGHYDDSSTLTPSMILDSGDGQVGGDGAYTRAAGSTDGAVYVVAGSSGQTSGGSLDHPAMFISLNELGSLVLDVDGSTLDATFLDDAGAVRDTFTISKR